MPALALRIAREVGGMIARRVERRLARRQAAVVFDGVAVVALLAERRLPRAVATAIPG